MTDSQAINAERRVQPLFMKLAELAMLLPGLCVLLFAAFLERLPDRVELGPRTAQVRFEPVQISNAEESAIRVSGAWTVQVEDPRFGGISALAIDRDRLLALTDSGVLVQLPKPGSGDSRAVLDEIPDGPRNPDFKLHRDTEALVRDPAGRGWWVAFETWHQLWLYDDRFQRALGRVKLGSKRWRRNKGVESLVASDGALIAIPEAGGEMVRIGREKTETVRLPGSAGPFSDAVRLTGGRLLLLERRVGWGGFTNVLVELDLSSGRPAFSRRIALPLGRLDNGEALALERRGDGGLRLWLMTDNNQQRPLRTLLVVFDLQGTLSERD